MRYRVWLLLIISIIYIGCSNRNMRDQNDIVYVYDDNGRRVRMRLDEALNEQSLIEQYDSTGRLCRVMLRDESGDILNVQEFAADGSLIKEESYRNGRRTSYTTFNEAGLKISDNYILDDDRYIRFVYEYDDRTDDESDNAGVKRRSAVTKYDGDRQVYRQTNDPTDDAQPHNGTNRRMNIAAADRIQKFEYGGNVIRETMTDKSGRLIYEYEKDTSKSTSRYTKYENGNPVAITEYNLNDGILHQTSLRNGKIVGETESDFDGNVIREAEYKNGILNGYTVYNRDQGRLTSRRKYSADNKLNRIYKYEYKNGVTRIVTYDGSGHLVEYED